MQVAYAAAIALFCAGCFGSDESLLSGSDDLFVDAESETEVARHAKTRTRYGEYEFLG